MKQELFIAGHNEISFYNIFNKILSCIKIIERL